MKNALTNRGLSLARSPITKIASAAILAAYTAGCGPEQEQLNYTCPDSDGSFYTWQLSNIYHDQDHLSEVAEALALTNGSVLTDHDNILWMLETFEAADLKYTPSLVSWADSLASDGKSFSLNNWKAGIDSYIETLTDKQLQQLKIYIKNGTWDGAIVLDDVDNFKGSVGSETLDEMARYILETFEVPERVDFKTIVRHDPTDLLELHPEGYEFKYLNTIYAQANAIKISGDMEGWLMMQEEAAARLGLLNVVWGMNIVNWENANADGVCESGYDGWVINGDQRCAATPDQIEEYADAIDELGLCRVGTGVWKVSDASEWSVDYSDFYEVEEYSATIRRLAEVAMY